MLLLLLVAMIGLADPVQPVAPAPTPAASASPTAELYRELDSLRSANAILTERIKNAELSAKVSALLGAAVPTTSGAAGQSPVLSTPSASLPPGLGGLRIQLITGFAGKFKALLQTAEGSVMPVQKGSQIQNNWIVKIINGNAVIIEDGDKHQYSLPFAVEQPASAASQSTNPASALLIPPISGGNP
jgi:type IV pilus biogenesis protein PilP